MKKATLSLLCLCSIIVTRAQFYKSITPSSAFADSLTRVVADFKSNYYPIQGKQLMSQGTVDVFQSKVGMPGASHCIIQRYHSEEDTTASWQAIMYEGDSYEEAVKVYKATYNHTRKSKIKYGEKNYYAFTGELEAPSEEVKFTVTPLRLNTLDKDYKYFYAEVEIVSSYDGWEVHLNLHSRKNDDEKY